MADRFDGGGHLRLPQRAGIVENPHLLDLMAGMDRRTLRGADEGGESGSSEPNLPA